MRTTLWVAVCDVSPRTRQKLAGLHGLDADEVREAVCCVAGLVFVWDVDEERGERALVRVRIGVLVVLYPQGDDEFHLGSAYRI